jgi:hypothetical protein
MSAQPEPGQTRDRLVHIDVTFILPRRLAWLLAGIAVGNLRLPDGVIEAAAFIRRLVDS